jgi:hypothetical protein
VLLVSVIEVPKNAYVPVIVSVSVVGVPFTKTRRTSVPM